jgi:hypothetical protein
VTTVHGGNPRFDVGLKMKVFTKQVKSVPECIAAVEGPQHPDCGGFDALTLEEIRKWFHIPGLGIAVIDNFQIHWAKGYGIADMESGAEVNNETLFQAGSISKPVTAMAILKTVQDGKFSLDEDINEILRDEVFEPIGMTHRLNRAVRWHPRHTARRDGIWSGDALALPEPGPRWRRDISRGQIAARSRSAGPGFTGRFNCVRSKRYCPSSMPSSSVGV